MSVCWIGSRTSPEGAPHRFLHSEAFYAVAQKKYVFIYDQNGVELQYVICCCRTRGGKPNTALP